VKAIVTVKLHRPSIQHDPHHKKVGPCPLNPDVICTDVTGSHHSYIEEGADRSQIERRAKQKHQHITRIEVMKE